MTSINSDISGLGFDPEALHRTYLEERDRRLQADGSREYVDLEGDLAKYSLDPYVEPGFSRAAVEEEIDVVLLGGGLAGLMTASNLLNAGVANFRILEQAGDFGGVWYWNRYPGIRCDVESYVYIPLLEEVGTVPTEKYAEGKEILAHCQAIGRKYGLYEKALFQTVVQSICWDERAARWTIRTNRGDRIRARHVIVSSGPLHKAKLPSTPGIQSFKGAAFHTSRWDYGFTGGDSSGNLTGLLDKRVALIGTGATGIQVLPHLADSAKRVYVVQRTPAAVDRRNNRPTDVGWYKNQPAGWQKERIENFCLNTLGFPQDKDLVDDCWTELALLFHGFSSSTNEAIQNATPEERYRLLSYLKMEQLRTRIAEIVENPATAGALMPWYDRFCKRPLFSDDYYPLFNKSNVTLVDTMGKGIERITEDSLIVNGKRYEVDCIVFATGFRVGAYPHRSGGYELIGRNGVSLENHWSKGLRTVHGLQSSGFPNFYIVGTLGQASQSSNYPHVTSFQTAQAARLIAHCLNHGIRTMEVTPEAEQRWAAEMATRAADNSVFEGECTPGYYNNEGKKDAGPSLFRGMYGGGPLEYIAHLDRWYEKCIKSDTRIEYENK